MNPGPSPVQIVLISVLPILLFPAFWLFVTFLISRSWVPLAASFRAKEKPQGTTLYAASARVGWANYKGCLTMVVADEGLYMKVWPIFAAFQPPVLIPWNAFGPLEEHPILFGRWVSTTIQLPQGKTIRLGFFRTPALFQLLPEKLGQTQPPDSARVQVEKKTSNSPWSQEDSLRK